MAHTDQKLGPDSSQLNDAAEIAKLLSKLKRERELRSEMAEQLQELEERSAVFERKYRTLLGQSGTFAASEKTLDARLGEIIEIAKTGVDAVEIQGKIAAYHETLDKKGYNHVWRERLDLILREISTGEFNLPRALARVRRSEERKRKMGLDDYPWVINDAIVNLPWRPAAASYRAAVFEAVIDQVRPNTSKIIETGSGWGEHLCNIYLEGGPVDATYYAYELEEEGRKCSQVLAALDSSFKLQAKFFDYCNPDWSDIPRDEGHTILLTAHSVEQVGEIHPDCLYGALSLSNEVTGIHFEPIGWQTDPESEWTDITRAHYERCMKLHYNRNLWSLLCEMRDKGLIRIERLATNFIGLDYNPATLIIWHKN